MSDLPIDQTTIPWHSIVCRQGYCDDECKVFLEIKRLRAELEAVRGE